ncbi:MAG TPA: hypothetical protein VJ732_14495 [Bryobacteraceae bacterium]|nr:hypothetical protein [Bryobacteraceae bacterium]
MASKAQFGAHNWRIEEEDLRKMVQAALAELETAAPENREKAAQKMRRAVANLNEFIFRTKGVAEENLRDALEQAGAEYHAANEKFRRLTDLYRDLGAEHPDGPRALAQAVAVHNESFRKYRAALKAFNDFVLDGKLPAEDAPTEKR